MSAEPMRSADRRNEMFRAMIGLIVIWASFYLVAVAQDISSKKRPTPNSRANPEAQGSNQP